MCGAFERKEIWFLKNQDLQKYMIYRRNTAELSYAWQKNNWNCKYLALLHWVCHLCRTVLVNKFSAQEGSLNWKKKTASVEKIEIWNYEIMASTFNIQK